MEDVIDVMEDLITKITETETRRNQSPSTVPSDDVTNVNPVKSKSGNMEIIVLDESVRKAFEYQNEINVQVDPLSTDTENVVVKKEPVAEMVVCKEVIRTLDAEDNLDDIDLAMEVVEEIVVEEVIVDDELDPTSSGEHKANGCEEQVAEFKTLQTSTSIMDDERVKVQADDSKCPQLIDSKVEGSGDIGNGEDGDDECEDDDDDDDDVEYDGDEDDEEEEGKDVKKDDLTGGNGVTTDNKPPTLIKQQPETDDLENIIPEVSINRRSSQESTTTTTTTTTTETSTANSSSSTSDSEGDSSTSNEDSSNSSSNSDCDNDSESNSEEAEPTTATPSVASSALADKKTRQIPVTAKGGGAKKRDSARNDGQGPNHGMYVM